MTHTMRCGWAKGTKCKCVCGGQRHQELRKKQQEIDDPTDIILVGKVPNLALEAGTYLVSADGYVFESRVQKEERRVIKE